MSAAADDLPKKGNSPHEFFLKRYWDHLRDANVPLEEIERKVRDRAKEQRPPPLSDPELENFIQDRLREARSGS
jgi:hypothetical protein